VRRRGGRQDFVSPPSLERLLPSPRSIGHVWIYSVADAPDDDPEIGRGLAIAFEHGVADLDENDEWVVGDASRL
jgi:hypothetical protein